MTNPRTPKKTEPTPTPIAPWDQHSRDGRDRIRAAVEGALGEKPRRVGEIAATLGMPVSLASPALRWLADRGRAPWEGERGQRTYTRAVTK